MYVCRKRWSCYACHACHTLTSLGVKSSLLGSLRTPKDNNKQKGIAEPGSINELKELGKPSLQFVPKGLERPKRHIKPEALNSSKFSTCRNGTSSRRRVLPKKEFVPKAPKKPRGHILPKALLAERPSLAEGAKRAERVENAGSAYFA